jgi:ribosomal protein L37AE/L43A
MDSLQRLVGVYGTTGRPFYQCAQCGASIIADAWSEFVNERQVRNVWSCEACGYQFETAAYFPKVNKAA